MTALHIGKHSAKTTGKATRVERSKYGGKSAINIRLDILKVEATKTNNSVNTKGRRSDI